MIIGKIFGHSDHVGSASNNLTDKITTVFGVWYVAVPIISLVTLGLIMLALYCLIRFTKWQPKTERNNNDHNL